MGIINSEFIASYQEGVGTALKDLREHYKLPTQGDIVFPWLYLSRTCYQLSKDQHSHYLSVVGKCVFAISALFFSIFLIVQYKHVENEATYIAVGISILAIIICTYLVLRVLNKGKSHLLKVRPLLLYMRLINNHVCKVATFKLLLLDLICFLLPMGYSLNNLIYTNKYIITLLVLLGFMFFATMALLYIGVLFVKSESSISK